MKKMKNSSLALITASIMGVTLLSTDAFCAPRTPQAQGTAQTAVAVIVNGNAITNYDIQRRAAFLKLQRKTGNLNAQAKDELVEEMLKRVEMKKRNINVSDDEVNKAFLGFAERNHMTTAQLTEMLSQTGVTADHFKNYIRTQMGWGRLVSARYRAEGGIISEQEAVQRMLKNGGVKPTANEYELQQVIFVVPNNRRAAILGKRKQDAELFRSKFSGCANLKQQATTMLDVTVRNLGRVLEPQLPEEWEKAVKATPVGRMTPPQETARGIEAIAVCGVKKVSDDKVAQLVFTIQDNEKSGDKKADDLSEKYVKELREKARIETP
ncbi:peptidylprolyl isomerase [uncultured Bartonella sp.]|uniref:peptidylprolyl isomerase n=1 Tax=uncultured Bartonella sp. TaxID=104108 RepID=UPI00262E3557|nr:peptidylprolyl isomerase [uncultured Bartonella sp.]